MSSSPINMFIWTYYGRQVKKNIIGLQDWASNEAQNQRNICSAIMFVSRRNQHARLGHTHVWPLACAYSCIHMCNMYQYFWIPILLFTYILWYHFWWSKSLQRLGQVRPREDGGSQVHRSDIAGPHVDEERLVGFEPWGWGRQIFDKLQFFPTS